MNALHDALLLPLDGIRAVEASAGTGKTFTIATLYLRLLLEHELKVDEIVVATFTRAAAAELSTRLRARIVIADEVLARSDPTTPRADDDGEHAQTRKVIAQALHGGATMDALRQRVDDARLAIDTAYIGTLHGLCHRALAEFGFDTGQALAQPELIEDIGELESEIVRDFWRVQSRNREAALLLADTWGAPETLAAQAGDARWRERIVDALASTGDLSAAGAAFARARHEIAAWDDAALQRAVAEVQRAVGNASARTSRVGKLQVIHVCAKSSATDAAFADAARSDLAAFAAAEFAGKKWFKGPFEGVELPALQRLAESLATFDSATDARRDNLLRDARTFLEAERPRRLAERDLMGHDEAIDRLAAALADSTRGERTAARIRDRWKAALIDEFQDTDTQQWGVVEKLFGPTTLVMVGDPKQAIYGFRGGDVFAWLEARAKAGDPALQLTESWRSGAGMCAAINALFSRDGAFIEAGIEHPDIAPAPAVAPRALLRDGEPLPALELWWLDPEQIGIAARSRVPSKAKAHAAIERACVAWISTQLNDDSIRLRNKRGEIEALRPKHIAVLVNSNAEAAALQAALGRVGVAASCNLRASVYASDEAADLALLLDALVEPDDLRRARAAQASLLIGTDAITIAAGIGDDARRAALLEQVAAWATAVRQRGPAPWLHRLIADAAPRLLGLPDCERRVANYLQLADLLQALHATCFGLADLATRFARARVAASDDADAARLRLDTDADAVTISTVHAAKGLEYDVVLVPYAVMGRDPKGKQSAQPSLHWYHDDANAAHVAIGNAVDAALKDRAEQEILAEDVRKFYVAVTRASALCVLPWGPVSRMQHSAAFHLLHTVGQAAPFAADTAGCAAALRALCERADEAAQVVDLPTQIATVPAHAAPAATPLHARRFTRGDLERDWQVWSFSRLVRGSANRASADPRPGAGDGEASADAGPAGPAFGSAVHAVFERTDFAAWRDAPTIPASEMTLLESSLRDGSISDARAIALTGTCVRDALNANLPCGVRLCDVGAEQRKAEIEFHLSLAPARSAELFELLHAHDYQRARSGVAPTRLHGLLTGKIDLTFTHAGRFHIIDWKTNRCAPYDDAALRAEIAAHDYDLQWLIYTLALHRWLRQRLVDYDYDRHVGAVYYLFVRGMGDGGGIHVDRPARALVEALDALFDAHAGSST